MTNMENPAGIIKVKSMQDWTEKYRPKTLSEVIGHPTAMVELRNWGMEWTKGKPKNRCVILHGSPGSGKTSTAYALANDLGWEVVELNASDQRTAGIIKKIAGSASQMITLEGSKIKRLIILDEADSIHGSADRGGEKAIIDVIKKTNQPMILTANELFDMSPALRGSCKAIQFKSISDSSISRVLRNIAEKEGVNYGIGVIEKIIENANGDLRSAIHDLQAIHLGREKTEKIELSDVITGQRDSKESIFKVLGKIFKGSNIIEAIKATMEIDEDPDSFIQWIDENLPLEYTKPEDLAKGYHYLGRASLFLGRVKRRRDYGMWRYANALMTSGMVVSRSQKYMGFTQFQFPSIRKTLGQTKGIRLLRDSIAKKIGMKCHVGKSFARSQLFPFFKMLIKDERYKIKIIALLGLEPDEIAYFLGAKSITEEVQKIYDESRILIEKDRIRDIEIYGGFGEGRKSEEDAVKEYKEEKFIEELNKIKEEGEKREDNVDEQESEGKKEEDIEKNIKKEDKNQKSLFDF